MSNATIIAAIDGAIEAWAGKPISLSINGRQVTYRSLKDLTDARTYYSNLSAAAGDIRNSFKIAQYKSGKAY